MPIFRYTLKKILVSPSTWVIFILTLIVLGLSWGLPVGILSKQATGIPWTKDLVLTVFLSSWKLLAFTAFIGLMLLIFIGVKATQIFRDEIEDGTLLILVSKPISRNRIWAEKWLSFQVTVISYIFFSILLDGLLLIMPGIGNTVIYLTFLPYMGILFGIALLFDLIFTSIVLLLSLVLNSKATIAITVGFAALTNIFSQAIDPLVSIPEGYFQISQAVTVFHDFENKVATSDDINWFKEQLIDSDYKSNIATIMQKVYDENIPGVSYPAEYDWKKEQEVVHAIVADPLSHPNYSTDEVALLSHIINVSNVFRQWSQQSYQELMTSDKVGQNSWFPGQPGSNSVNYSAYDVIKGLSVKLSQNQLDNYNNKIVQKRVMRYFNVFYQLYYLWNGAWGDNASLYVSNLDYRMLDDPFLISFSEISNNQYQVNVNSGKHKILEFPALVSFYVILGLALLGTSWYVFNRRDFT